MSSKPRKSGSLQYSLYQRGNLWWTSFAGHDGRRRQQSTGSPNRRDAVKIAERAAQRHLLAIDGNPDLPNQYKPAIDLPIENVVDDYMDMPAVKREESRRGIQAAIEQFIGDSHIRRFSDVAKPSLPDDLAAWLSSKDRGDAVGEALRGFLDYGFERELIPTTSMPAIRHVLGPAPGSKPRRRVKRPKVQVEAPKVEVLDAGLIAMARRLEALSPAQRAAIMGVVEAIEAGNSMDDPPATEGHSER